MAKEYLDKLTRLIQFLEIEDEVSTPMEIKHFFSGAALYINGKICVSWSPVGLAFKLGEEEVSRLIESGAASPLKYFAKGHIKKGYALFENPEDRNQGQWKKYFFLAAQLG